MIYQGGAEVPVFRCLSPWQWVRWQLLTRLYGWSEERYLRLMIEVDGWGLGGQTDADIQ